MIIHMFCVPHEPVSMVTSSGDFCSLLSDKRILKTYTFCFDNRMGMYFFKVNFEGLDKKAENVLLLEF